MRLNQRSRHRLSPSVSLPTDWRRAYWRPLIRPASIRIQLVLFVVMVASVDGWMPSAEGSEVEPRTNVTSVEKRNASAPSTEPRPNVLLILVDDLKPALGCYGDEAAVTPNIDSLARRGMRFDLAYCNQAVCAPSRFSLMLGSHSTATGLYGLGSQLRKEIPNAVTLPQYFSKHGYRTESLGKIFHIGHGNQGDPDSFEVEHFHDKVIEYVDPKSTDGGKLTREEAYFTNQKLGQIRSLPRGAAFESPDVDDDEYADGRVANETVRRLRAAKARREKTGKPFLIAAGFVRPHLPFSAPKKYWDRFDPESLPGPEFETDPINAPPVALKRGGEITNYAPVPQDRPIPETLRKTLIHGYYASTSFVDAQIGKVLNELRRLELEDKTVVVLWGDHGFHLGDHGYWTKHTNYEQANRIPLLVVAPGVTRPATSSRQLVESVDLYPTLAALCDLPVPTGPQPINGINLVPVMKDSSKRLRDHAFHAYPRSKLGRAIRTERYRLVEWRKWAEADSEVEYELYDYETDPEETRNLASISPDIVDRLKKILARYPQPVARGRQRRSANASPKYPTPKISQRNLKVMAEVESADPQGVVVAQGGKEYGYALHFLNGKPVFDVRIAGKVTSLKSRDIVRGKLKLEAGLDQEWMTLIVNGREVARRASPGWIPIEPKDGLSVGRDDLTAAGDYQPPNPFSGKVRKYAVNPGDENE